MIALDEEALICDLAETYQIYDYRRCSATLIGTLSVGLGNDSRIKRKIQEIPMSEQTMFLVAILDRLDLLLWLNSSDGAKGRNRPTPLLQKLLNQEEEGQLALFETGEEFDRYIRSVREGG